MTTKRHFQVFIAGAAVGAVLMMGVGATIRKTQFVRIAVLEAERGQYLAEREMVLRLARATSNLALTAEAYTQACNSERPRRRSQLARTDVRYAVGGE